MGCAQSMEKPQSSPVTLKSKVNAPSEADRAFCVEAWTAHKERPDLQKLAKSLGLNKNVVAKHPPETLEQLFERFATRFYQDISAGASADIQICITRAGGHGIQESAEAKYCKILQGDQLNALITSSCEGIFKDGVAPLDMVRAWNGETGRGQQVASDEAGAGYLVSLKGYSTDDFDVACKMLTLMISACSKPCCILCVWAEGGPVEVHALSVRSASDKVINAIDRQKDGRRETVTPDRFVQLVIIEAIMTSNGVELDVDESYKAAMDEVRAHMEEAQPVGFSALDGAWYDSGWQGGLRVTRGRATYKAGRVNGTSGMTTLAGSEVTVRWDAGSQPGFIGVGQLSGDGRTIQWTSNIHSNGTGLRAGGSWTRL